MSAHSHPPSRSNTSALFQRGNNLVCTLTPAIDLNGVRQVTLAFEGASGRVLVELAAREAGELGFALQSVISDPELRTVSIGFAD